MLHMLLCCICSESDQTGASQSDGRDKVAFKLSKLAVPLISRSVWRFDLFWLD